LALVKNGDLIALDLEARTLTLLVDDGDMMKRRAFGCLSRTKPSAVYQAVGRPCRASE